MDAPDLLIKIIILVRNIGARKLAEATRTPRGNHLLEALTQYFSENVGARKLAEAMRKLRAEACLTVLVRNTGARKLAEAMRKLRGSLFNRTC